MTLYKNGQEIEAVKMQDRGEYVALQARGEKQTLKIRKVDIDWSKLR